MRNNTDGARGAPCLVDMDGKTLLALSSPDMKALTTKDLNDLDR